MDKEISEARLAVLGDGALPARLADAAEAAAGVDSFLAGQLSPLTRKAYRTDFTNFLEFLELEPGIAGEEMVRALCRVDRQRATVYRDGLIEQGYAPSTIARRLSVVSQCYDILKEEGAVEKNPFSRVKRPKLSREGKTAALTKRKAEKLISSPDRSTQIGHRDFVLLALLFYCGLRRHEAVKIRVDDFQETSGHIVLRVLGKGGKEANVKVAPALWREVRAYVEQWSVTGYLFPAMSRNKKLNDMDKCMSTTAVWQLWKKYCRKCGLDSKALSPHSARSTAITLALDGGASVRQVQAFARHSDANTTLRYDRGRQNLDDNAVDYLRIKLAE